MSKICERSKIGFGQRKNYVIIEDNMNYKRKRRDIKMIKAIKKLNRILRVLFIGFIVIYGLVKIFDIVPKNKKESAKGSVDEAASEFDEIW